MCGRYSAAGTLNELAKLIDFVCRAPFFAPRYNVAPRQSMPVIVLENFQPVMKPMRWGLIPSWAKDESIGDKLINARAETIAEKTSFKKPFHSQRCLIPADGFYEWQRRDNSFTPFRFRMRDDSFFCFAGIYEKWIRPPREGEFEFNDFDEPPPSRVIETFSIITTEANDMVFAVHERMPVILGSDSYLRWIDCQRYGSDDVFIRAMLHPYPAEEMDCYRVSKLVNNAKNDSPECLKPA
jgi:putative SOS response-associated peptidase YedK